MSIREAECIGGGTAHAGHGDNCVLIAFSSDVGWWRNSVWLTPDAVRLLASELLTQADYAEEVARGARSTRVTTESGTPVDMSVVTAARIEQGDA